MYQLWVSSGAITERNQKGTLHHTLPCGLSINVYVYFALPTKDNQCPVQNKKKLILKVYFHDTASATQILILFL